MAKVTFEAIVTKWLSFCHRKRLNYQNFTENWRSVKEKKDWNNSFPTTRRNEEERFQGSLACFSAIEMQTLDRTI